MSTVRLYELTNALQQVETMIDEGVEGLEAILEGLEMNFSDKAEGIAKIIRTRLLEAEKVDQEIKRLSDIKKRLTNSAEGLHNYLETQMLRLNLNHVPSTLFKIQFAKNPPHVVVVNESLVPMEFKRVTVTTAVAKADVKKAIDDGIEVPGCYLQQDSKLKIK